MKSSAAFVVFVFLSSFIPLYGQNKKLSIAGEPAWISNMPVDYNKNALDAEAEDGYVDLAYQKQIALASQTTYYKIATKILSESGVQNNSQISIDFDPVYERITLHTVKIIRNGTPINKLQLSKFKTVQKETDLQNFMYNGMLTALLFLEDVRKDDIIEYSFSRTGFNPIYGGRYAGVFDAAFSVPVYQLFYKLVVPDARSINIKNSNTNTAPVVTKTTGATAYEWKLTDLAAQHVQDNLPSWYNAYPIIMVSEYKSWQEVSDWATALFPFNISISPALKNKIEEIKSTNATPETRTLAALHFVQDEVRYLGIEMGESSHKPSNPNKIFAQRFGDCKDKTYLLCTLLRAMDIEADPVLINTTSKATIKNWPPSTRAFDHVTTRAVVNNHTYFFDATIPYQRGNINTIAYPDYQCGLLVKNNTTGLTDISTNKNAFVQVKEVFNIPDMHGAAHLIVTTNYTGSNADATRSDFKNSSKFELLKTYKKYYAAYFEKIEADSINFKDSEDGTFTTYEYYTIPFIWKLTDDLKKSSFSPFVIYGLLKKPSDKSRTMPFYLDYPLHYKEDVEVNLPEDWDGKSYSSNTSCANFTFSEHCIMSDRKMEIKYEYENLKDHVTPDEATAYFNSYKEADENVNYDLTWKEGETSFTYAAAAHVSDSPANRGYMVFYTFLGICVLITVVIKNNRKERGY